MSGNEGIGHCRNCGLWLGDVQKGLAKFCPQCGQETREHLPGFFEYLHELVTHYVALEGKLWPTLRLLFLRPGMLAREHFEGRRERYVRPLRLYLTFSILFFLSVKLLGASSLGVEINLADPQRLEAPVINFAPGENWGWMEPLRAALEARAAQKQVRLEKLGPEAIMTEAGRSLLGMIPYALFIYLPLYAATLALVYRSRRRTYGEHLVVTLYSYAFLFASLLAFSLLPWDAARLALLMWLLVYVTWELKTVYGGSWWEASWRGTLVGALSFFPFVIITSVVAAVAILA